MPQLDVLQEMDPVPTSIITSFRDSRSLVSIDREKISKNTIQGFIVDFDDEWILLHYVYDFQVDGWLMLRRYDITALQSKTTDVFQKVLLEEENVYASIDFSRRIPTGGIAQLIANFDKQKVVILEEETEDDDTFNIGFVIGIEDDFVSLRTFSGAGRFDEDDALVALEELTSLSFDSNYALYYERYFSRRRIKEKAEQAAT